MFICGKRTQSIYGERTFKVKGQQLTCAKAELLLTYLRKNKDTTVAGEKEASDKWHKMQSELEAIPGWVYKLW